MKMLPVGVYTFKGLFMVVDQELLDKKLQPISESFGSFEIEIKEESAINDIINKYLPKLNKFLPKFLKSRNIKRWFPYRTSSYEIKDNIISIGYYHDEITYNIIYKSKYIVIPFGTYPQLISKYPNEVIYEKVYKPICLYPEPNRYYGIYDLDVYSKEIYMDDEEASISFNNIISTVLNSIKIDWIEL